MFYNPTTMKTFTITKPEEIILADSHIVDTGEIPHATIIVENSVQVKYTVVPKS